jgi:hypothetical protein
VKRKLPVDSHKYWNLIERWLLSQLWFGAWGIFHLTENNVLKNYVNSLGTWSYHFIHNFLGMLLTLSGRNGAELANKNLSASLWILSRNLNFRCYGLDSSWCHSQWKGSGQRVPTDA